MFELCSAVASFNALRLPLLPPHFLGAPFRCRCVEVPFHRTCSQFLTRFSYICGTPKATRSSEVDMAPEKESNGLDNYAFALEGHFCDLQDTKHEEEVTSVDHEHSKLAYCVTDVPPWYLCVLLGIQHCLTAFGGIIAIPLILSQGLCLQHDGLTQSYLISTIFFVSGICTLLQVTFGIRLPILQGGTFTLLAPSMAMLSMPEWTCPAWTQNATLVNTSSSEFIEVWQSRMRALQGSIMVGSLFQVVVGFSGLIGIFMRFIGPLTIAPTISLIGLSLFDSAGTSAGNHWGISAFKDKKLHSCRVYVFQILPVLLGIALSWLLCYILTTFNALPSDPGRYGYLARTDIKGDVVGKAPWILFPYPGQWGLPTVSLAGVVGILAGVISSMIESVGDYHACARLSGAPPPPKHAINRGIGMEGLGSLLAGAWGTGNGTTSYSENVGALGITKVGSRTVIVAGGVFMIVMGVFGKVGAIFSTIPSPVIGGMFMVMFGVISAAGISTLQYADLNSSRNIFVFGFSMFSGLVIPNWIVKNPAVISTGVAEVDQLLQVPFTTSMFVGGFFGFLLDNTVPGTKQERGILAWNKAHEDSASNTLESGEVYDLPFGLSSYFSSCSWIRYVPFCPPCVPKRPEGCESKAVTQEPTQTLGPSEPPHIIIGVAH
uniref:xan_ur_permease domain-containing protein isoform X2 n=1 Tax=Doryrhamphus excisus TaxID=161450 RepID=UPI0025AEB5A3|nr:xan_ur_permease domain-containing protein isoform X2 [Doryrhamphus excisus]